MPDLRSRWLSSIIALSLLLAAGGMASAMQSGASAEKEALQRLLDHWAAMKDVHTLEAKFLCEKRLAALDTPLESSGRVWIRKEQKAAAKGEGAVRFSTENPYVSEVILTDGKVFARSQHEPEWTRTNQSSRPGLTAVMGQLGAWSTGDASKLAEMYRVTSSDEPLPALPANSGSATGSTGGGAQSDTFLLTPTNADLAKAVKGVTLAVDRQSHALRFIEIRTQQEDVTRYWFSDVKTNVPLPDDVFKAGSALMMPAEGQRP